MVDDDDGGRLSLADLANQADEVDDDADEEIDEESAEIPDALSLNKMRKPELVELASSLGKESSGTKADIIARIVA